MAEKKQVNRFYNWGEYKGMTKRTFFELVQMLLEGEELDDRETAFVSDAVDHELELIVKQANTPGKRNTEHKDWRQSGYAQAIYNRVVPLLSSTNPLSLTELTELANAEAPTDNGKSWSMPWIARVLNDDPQRFTKVDKVVTKTDKKGLKRESVVSAYLLA